MNTHSRDLGFNHAAGKGDNDRTSDRARFNEGLSNIAGMNSADRTGFALVGLRRYRKTYGAAPATPPAAASTHDQIFPAS